ncbi:MAG: septum site-determining protein MinC [Alteromonadaceae bacterium]|nr:MAG: septum site-determining protein MinC [Alteromonadaceae bacterium]
MSASVSVSRPESFQIKGTLLPLTVLELRTFKLEIIDSELRAKVATSPSFFAGNPVVISFEVLSETESQNVNLEKLSQLCRQLGFIVVGIKIAGTFFEAQAKTLGLAVFTPGRNKNAASKSEALDVADTPAPEDSNNAVNDEREVEQPGSAPVANAEPIPAKVIDEPVRSGQQIYVPGDMIILSSVSAGAEVLAGGSIHVYGPLRGRALAGVQGIESARIFCQSQEAELISIAGHFMIDEELRNAHWREPVQAWLQGDILKVDKI